MTGYTNGEPTIKIKVNREDLKIFLCELQFVAAYLDQYAPNMSGRMAIAIQNFYGTLYDGPERISCANPREIFP